MAENEYKTFTLAEVNENSSAGRPLIVINNSVYDVTSFLNEVTILELYFKISTAERPITALNFLI